MRTSSPRQTSWEIFRFKDEDGAVAAFKKAGHSATEVALRFPERLITTSEFGPNGLTDSYKPIGWSLVIGAAGQVPYSNANSRLGVSTDSTGFDHSQSNLNPSGLATFYMQLIDPTFPIIAGDQVKWEATFDGNTANFSWNSFGVDNDAIDGAGPNIASYGSARALMNRFVVDQGTKVLTQTWVISLVIQQT